MIVSDKFDVLEEDKSVSANMVSMAVEQMADMVVITDANGVIQNVNRAFVQMTGYNKEEVLGTPVTLLKLNEDNAEDFTMLSQAILSGEACRGTVLNRDKFGGLFHEDRCVTPLKDESGAIIGFISCGRRIIDDKLDGYITKLEATNRDLKSFAYRAAHDILTPIRHIEGFCDLLEENIGDDIDKQSRDHLKHLCAASISIGQITKALLELARTKGRQLIRKEINLSILARSIIEELQINEPDRSVEIRIQDGLMAMGDSTLLDILMRNLLENAWKFTGKCSAGQIEFGEDGGVNKRVYYVRDNGAGFDMEYKEKLFQPFQRLHRQNEFEGTGLGLATVEQIVSCHGGRVWAESVVGTGATVWFTLNEKADIR